MLIQGLIQTYINFDGTLSSWWTKIATGILLFLFIGLQQGMLKLAISAAHRQAGVAKPYRSDRHSDAARPLQSCGGRT